MRAKTSNAGLKSDFGVSIGGTESSDVAVVGNASMFQVSKKLSGHAASHDDNCKLCELPGASVFVGGEQHDVTADLSTFSSSSRCAQQPQQF